MGAKRTPVSAFLAKAKSELSSAIQNGHKVTIVSGNQSADLDSMSSSILYSYFRSHAPPAEAFTTTYIPLLNIPKEDIDLRPEFKLIFETAGIDASQVSTLSDLPKSKNLRKELPPENTRWILVDHNKLEGDLGEVYGDRVHGCIDHHWEEHSVPKHTAPEPRILVTCGSCTSLVIKYHKPVWASLPPATLEDMQLAQLALGSVLIDTKNLKDQSKVHEVDSAASDFLINKIVTGDEMWNQEKFYADMDAAKKNIECLPLQGILRKDYKQWTEVGTALGMSSVVKPLEFLVGKAKEEAKTIGEDEDVWGPVTDKFMKDRELDVHSVSTSFMQDGTFMREICIYWKGKAAGKAVERFEKESGEELKLEKKHIDGMEGENRKIWRQRAINHTRKTIGPMLRKAIRNDSNL